ncbi:conserved hypothetical protein [Xylanimonas cellulosilytica DSM 15894]|uniref:Uncharacterized protein n=1 Tax=Xylanimonas cellulosilytica (strain DSM 15894 / JCM 12276 / CECT 5975 / KCTC 9989 / LMG 20990 / NBRC 107835 / XIL07) TaxID=446471 RepID=D1BT15_XYLCX|nr:DUF6448 family protein [Xylanimonas cellulosilytica]ACZ30857.1 conserved hypothetical protein [Xylanimonas cellulosilytica DSM 15894]
MSLSTRLAHRPAHRLAQRLAERLVQPASAHCDTADGPVVTAGRRALAEGNVNIALKWVQKDADATVRAAFEAATAAGTDDAELAFLTGLVRLHRAGEGHEFDGIKPAGTPQPPVVTAGDVAYATGDVSGLLPLVEPAERGTVEERFARAIALRDHDVDDVVGARGAVAAYVEMIHHAVHHRLGRTPA